MPSAIILNTASKASTTGGTFADTLTANSGDSLSIANYTSGNAEIFKMWGLDSANVAELALTDTRTETVTCTAADAVVSSWLTKDDNLPGVSGSFISWEQAKALRETTIGIR